MKSKIKQECSTGPKCVVSTLSAEMGGILQALAPGQLPRDEKQVTNFRSKQLINSRVSSLPKGLSRDAAADDLFVIMQKAYTETSLFGQLMLHLNQL